MSHDVAFIPGAPQTEPDLVYREHSSAGRGLVVLMQDTSAHASASPTTPVGLLLRLIARPVGGFLCREFRDWVRSLRAFALAASAAESTFCFAAAVAVAATCLAAACVASVIDAAMPAKLVETFGFVIVPVTVARSLMTSPAGS